MSIEHVRPREIIDEEKSPDILLINVPAAFQQGIIPEDEEPPFGLLRIAAAAEYHEYRPALLDAHRGKLHLSEIDDILYGLKPKSVGINPTSVNVEAAQEIAELCAERGMPLIIGGVHATLNPFSALEKDFPMAHAVIKGKGEKAIIHVLEDLKSGTQTDKKGVYYRTALSHKERRDYAEFYPLDKLPLIDQRRYTINPLMERVIVINNQKVAIREISLYETAGCPFQCTFCATPVLSGRDSGLKPYHRPSMDRILASTRLALETGANAIHFLDDMAFVSPQHFREFAQGVESFNLSAPFYWRGMTRAPIIAEKCTDEDLKILVGSGCWRIAMGIESGNENMLKAIKKGITKNQVRQAVIKLRQVGVAQVKGFFIMGFPEETMEQLEETRQFIMELKNLGLTDMGLFQFKPYPGTEEWQRLEKTNPAVLNKLAYIHVNKEANGIAGKKLSNDAALPDDIMIAAIPSKIVREIIIETIKDFYND